MNPLSLLILSVVGFAVSFYIYYTKKYDKNMYCIIGQDCDAVVKSKYGKTFGIENTIPGMIYYVLVFFCLLMLLGYTSCIIDLCQLTRNSTIG